MPLEAMPALPAWPSVLGRTSVCVAGLERFEQFALDAF